MGGIKTTLAFTKNLLTTGAVSETSREVELEVCKHIPEAGEHIIVEYGMGHGNITKEILGKMSSNSILYGFEVNERFCDHVRKEISDERLIIINDGAQNIKQHINQKISTIIATIPFSFFSKKKALKIIQDSYDLIGQNGYYSQALYTKFNFKKFQQIFDACEILKRSNKIPAEYIFHCQKIR